MENKMTITRYTEEICKSLPGVSEMKDGVIYHVKRKDIDVDAVSFKCPCGCGLEIYIPVSKNGNGHTWKIEEHEDKTLSLSPSIQVNTGCRSHFFIKNNKIVNS